MESFFFEEGVGVTFEGPVVRAGSLQLREGSVEKGWAFEALAPGCCDPGPWVLGLPEC